LLDPEVVRDVCNGCGWSAAEFRDFYLSGAAKALDELERAVKASDPKEVCRVAHGWAGSTASAGVVGLVAVLRRIEAEAADGRIDEEALGRIPALLDRVRADLDRLCSAT